MQRLGNLSGYFLSYCPFLTEDANGGHEGILSTFSMDDFSKAQILDDFQDVLTDMMTDRRFWIILKGSLLRNVV